MQHEGRFSLIRTNTRVLGPDDEEVRPVDSSPTRQHSGAALPDAW